MNSSLNSKSPGRVMTTIDNLYKEGAGLATQTVIALRTVPVETQDTIIQSVLTGSSTREVEALRSNGRDVAMVGLASAVFGNGFKHKLLKELGDTSFSMEFDEANALLEPHGFEKVHTFKFWPVDDDGVEVSTDLAAEENLVVWARRKDGLVVTVESYTSIDREANYFNRSANTIQLFYAWQDEEFAKSGRSGAFNPQASGTLVSATNPNWRREYQKAIDDGDAYKFPEDIAFVGRYDGRMGLFHHIRQLERFGKLVPNHPKGRDNFGSIDGVGFYTDYKRKEFLGNDGRFDHRNYEGIKALHAKRLQELPDWFLEMVGRK